ncbi:MAG TPA: hypothetical protein VFZ37_11320 [Jiangellaceae bacterium]
MAHLSAAGRPPSARLVIGLIAGIATFQALMLLAFAWPATESGPREVPIAVAGPEQVIAQLEQGLANAPGADDGTPAFDVTVVADEAAATDAIHDRDVYGALVVSPEGGRLLVASGGGPAVARMLQNAASAAIPDDVPLEVRDVVPPTEDDPSGSGLATGVLPLVLTSAAGGLVAGLALRRTGHRLASVAGLAVVAGFVAAALVQPVLGITDGSYWALAGTIALIVGAISAIVAGLGAVFGVAGAGLGMALMVLLGNPLSAAVSAPEMLPQPWGALGQLMPPGAGVTAVRSVGFFDGAAAGTPLLVLGIWLAAGLALVLTGALRKPDAGASEAIVAHHGEPAVRSS